MSTATATAENEGSASQTRLTRDGRKITYRVNVLQHPEKARACGQGAKSSTDRRPVDPPPIIDLHIFEEAGESGQTDITYAYRANFFMWASLEPARPLAQGRVPKESSGGPDLCGSPVSGISYLDRPTPAGYFIFPDLSIRHEGRYRLCFTLFEELRDPALADRDGAEGAASQAPTEHVNGRCVVRTKPFTVFSAKKFPGLSESTILSRTVAEQGCRVRIRRDVRMRRRDTKDMKEEWDDDEEDAHDSHSRRRDLTVSSADPQPQLHQPLPPPPLLQQQQQQQQPAEAASRTGSVSNVHAAPYQPTHRTSGPDLHAQYRGYPPQQHMPPPPPSTHHNYPPPPQQYEQQPPPPQYSQYMHQQPVAQSPQPLHHFQHQQQQPQQPQQHHYAYPPAQYYSYPAPGYAYLPQQPMQQPQQPMQSPVYPQQHPQNQMRPNNVSYTASPQDYQAASGNSQYPHHAPPPVPLGPSDIRTSRSSSSTQTPSTVAPNGSSQTHTANTTPILTPPNQTFPGKSLPPTQTHQAGTHPTYDHPSIHTSAPQPPPGLPSYQASPPPPPPPPPPFALPRPDPYHHEPLPPQYVSSAASGAPKAKRSYASSFNTTHVGMRLQSGARPDPSQTHSYGYGAVQDNDGSDDDEMEPTMMEYKRADGSVVSRQWPTLRA